MYLRLLRLPGVRRLVLAALLARIPVAMFATALALFIHDTTGSFAVAGAVSAVDAVLLAVSAPLLARVVDRVGPTPVLLAGAAGYSAGVWGLVAAGQSGASVTVLLVLSGVVGAAVPPLSGCMRALWPSLVAGSDLTVANAFALESVIVEAFFISGPLIAGAVIVVASPAAALVVAGAFSLLGTLAFASSPASRSWRPAGATDRSWAGAMRAPGIRALVFALVPFGAAFGSLSIALPAFAVVHRSPASAGLFWAVQAVGSAAGGLWYGVRAWRGGLVRRYLGLFVVFALGLAPLALASSILALCALIALSGLALAPVTAASFELTDLLAPDGARTEAFTWATTANVAGSAAGAALAGALVQGGTPTAGFLLACGLAAGGAGVAVAARGALRGAEVAPGG